MSRRETLELVRTYYRITDPVVRRRIYELAKSVAISQEALFQKQDPAVRHEQDA